MLKSKFFYLFLFMMVVWMAVACGKDAELPDKYSTVPIEQTEIQADDTESKTEETDVESEESLADQKEADQKEESDVSATVDSEENVTEEFSVIDPQGMTLESRIRPPEGYERPEAEGGSLLEFLRQYPVKEDGSPVLLYDGTEKWNQKAHVAVLDLPLEAEDLQQCADSIMRMYAEYFWASGQQERIAFHFTNGFEAEYSKWRDGQRIKLDGNQVSWVQSVGYDDSYETFVKYMRMVFSYAGTLSMDAEADSITVEEMQPGDVFLKGGSPGHVVMIVDVCENEQGERVYLLAQGYMPAQEFHILKNPARENDPWYYEVDICFPLITPEYVFEEGSLQRLGY